MTALGTLMAGSVPTGQGVGEWSSVEGFYCGGPLDWNLNFTAGDMPWHLDATSYAPATDTTTGTLTGLSLHAVGSAATADFDGPGGPGSGTGSVTFSYDNATHQLTLTGGNMEAYNVHGAIIGLLNDGDPVDFGTTMPVTPAQTIRPDGVTG
ncbi:hypothetical protein OG896_29375 [Streptomyces sp. NBC_00669]|uniref:hypothetical protein n=1 Tax=Streptomyces sp. NBC_00669 TaxID=2976011 RepID=UPI002E31FC88|nr:hypothetical protein [Streptomyces sp. NBC_00669]